MAHPVVYTALVWLSCAVVIGALAAQRRSPPLGLWAAGNAAAGLALLSFHYRPALPSELSQLVTNAGFLLGPLLMIAALRGLAHKPLALRPGLFLIGLVVLVNLSLGPADDTLAQRSAVGLLASLVLVWPLWPLLRDSQQAVRTVAALVAGLIALRIARFGLYLWLGGGEPGVLLSADAALSLVVGLLVVAANVSFLWVLVVVANEAAFSAKRTFIAQMGHELRTPLNAVLGFSQLLLTDRSGTLTPTQADWLGEVVVAGRQLQRRVDDLLDLARLEAGRVAFDLRPVPLDPLVAAVLRSFAPEAAATGVGLAGTGNGTTVIADPDRLRQVLANLVANALKYSAAGATVTLGAVPEGRRVRVTVADTGPGVPVERRAELFQPFSRLGAETSGVQGLGLGLSLVRMLTEAMDGQAGYAPGPDGGSHFWVALPTASAHRPGAVLDGDPAA